MWHNILPALRILLGKSPGNTVVETLSGTPLGTLLEDFTDAVVVYDPNFTILSLNKAAEALFDVRREELLGIRVDPAWVNKPRYRTFAQTLFPSLAPASVERSETGTWPQAVALTFENPHRELALTLHRITNTAGVPTTFMKIIHDETRTREVLSARSEFVGVAAHQLRTPLTALRWSLESMGGTLQKESERETLMKESLSLVDRCLKIVNDFLDAAKIEEGKFGFTFEETDLVSFLETLITTIAPIATRYEVSLFFNHEGIALMPLSIDPTRLGTAFLNVLDNAIRYNVKGGKVTVTLTREPSRVAIAVTDTGIGILKGEERKLFQKLERGSNAIQVEPNGSGLGLYIARNIVEGHGGTIEVASEANRGTTFTVKLPLARKGTA
ncbi:MAG: PAS domain-containing sensor histidine kinase [Candidatus Jorgensenbacteria bacterium]|nr:PAS domain-containing sensor histidine kinase [Candidatus Jorgensenbacteria bacterium]